MRWKCKECGDIYKQDQLVSIHMLEDPAVDWLTCPECREPNMVEIACEVDGCPRDGGCGTPAKDGYHWTCFEHRP